MRYVGHVLDHMQNQIPDHVPDHRLDHMLDYTIIGLVTTALSVSIKNITFLECQKSIMSAYDISHNFFRLC